MERICTFCVLLLCLMAKASARAINEGRTKGKTCAEDASPIVSFLGGFGVTSTSVRITSYNCVSAMVFRSAHFPVLESVGFLAAVGHRGSYGDGGKK